MKQILNDCTAQFALTPEYSTLTNYHMRDTRLTMDDKLRVAKSVEHTFAPLLDHLKADAPSLSDSDKLYCILSTLNIDNNVIAEMLAISADTVRVRKYRVRDKLPFIWYDLFFPDNQGLKNQNQETPVKQEKSTILTVAGNCFRNYFKISGRSSRTDYWFFLLFSAIVFVAIDYTTRFIMYNAPSGIMDPKENEFIRYVFYIIDAGVPLILIIPMYTVTVRRLHDLNLRGLLAIILCAIPIIILMVDKILRYVEVEWIIRKTEVLEEVYSFYLAIRLACQYSLKLFLIILILIFTKSGTVGPNDYGPDPLRFTPN